MQGKLIGLDRAIAQLPPGVAKIRCRWDSGYFAADLAKHCIDRGVEFAIGVKRNSAVVRASRNAPTAGWHPAKGMPHTEVGSQEHVRIAEAAHRDVRRRPRPDSADVEKCGRRRDALGAGVDHDLAVRD
jgi:hypothetical protein